jgi:Na+(H+)/acetate symporter ActP
MLAGASALCSCCVKVCCSSALCGFFLLQQLRKVSVYVLLRILRRGGCARGHAAVLHILCSVIGSNGCVLAGNMLPRGLICLASFGHRAILASVFGLYVICFCTIDGGSFQVCQRQSIALLLLVCQLVLLRAKCTPTAAFVSAAARVATAKQTVHQRAGSKLCTLNCIWDLGRINKFPLSS